jgi:hypothetical protein
MSVLNIVGMADIKHLKRQLEIGNGSIILISLLGVICVFLLADTFTTYHLVGNLLTGNVVAVDSQGQTQVTSSTNYIVSIVIYVLGFVVCGGAVFVMSRRTGELKVMITKEEEERMLSSNPKDVLLEFFEILSNWSIKNAEKAQVLSELQKVKHEAKHGLPAVGLPSFSMSDDRKEIRVSVGGYPGWKEVFQIFRVYLDAMHVEKDKLTHLAEFLGKSNLAVAVSKMDEPIEQQKKASHAIEGAAKKADTKSAKTPSKPSKAKGKK